MHCLCVVAVLMYVYVLSLCSGNHVYRQDVEAESFLAVSFVICLLLKLLKACLLNVGRSHSRLDDPSSASVQSYYYQDPSFALEVFTLNSD